MSIGDQYSTIIVGLGQTGFSCVEYFERRGVAVAVVDHHDEPKLLSRLQAEFPHVPFRVVDQAQAMLRQADRLIVSPGVPLEEFKNISSGAHPQEVMGDIELFCQEAKAPIVAITGSNGKTTVATLMARVISAAGCSVELCGNIGEPVLDVLCRPVPDYYVVELSSFQLEATRSLTAKVAVILNVEPDHMDRYASFKDYVEVKQRIYHGSQQAIVNCDQPEAWQPVVFKQSPVGFSVRGSTELGYGLRVDGEQVFFMRDDRVVMAATEMPLIGYHHWQNALAVLALTEGLQLPLAAALTVLRNFNGLPHRCQRVAIHQGVSWFNDSKATNVGAAVAAIETLSMSPSGRLIVIMGGVSKGADFSALRDVVKQFVSHVILIGQDAEEIAHVIQDEVSIVYADSMSHAVTLAAQYAQSGDTVALSPACASFDMFDNYQHRGADFGHWVEQL